MVAGLALVLSLAAPQATSPEAAPAPPSAGAAAPAQRVVRPADAPPPIVIEAPPPEAKSEKSAPDPSAEELQLQIDALRQQSAEKLQLQVDALRERRPSLVPPFIVLGVGVSCLVIGGTLRVNPRKDSSGYNGNDVIYGTGLIVAGAVATLVSLVWLVVDGTLRSDIDREIEALEAQRWSASSGVRVTPWARGGAGGLALSLPLP